MKRLGSALLLPWAIGLAGCQTPVVKQEHPQRVVLGPAASQYLQVTTTREGYSSSNLLRAGINGINESSQTQRIRYRFVWLDKSGFEIAGLPARWQYTALPPREPFTLEVISSSPEAVDYRIRIYDYSSSQPSLSQGTEK